MRLCQLYEINQLKMDIQMLFIVFALKIKYGRLVDNLKNET